MEDTPSPENPSKDFNSIDLTQLQDFRFGTQWTEIKKSAPSRREGDRPQRRDFGDDRPSRGPAGDGKRDRRSFQRPAGPAGAGAPADREPRREGPASGAPQDGQGRDNRDRGQGQRRFNDGPRGDRGAPRGERGPRQFVPEQPYISPFFNITFYPEDAGFSALVKAMRGSCRTFELFEIARLIIGKNDRFVVVVSRKSPEAGQAPAPEGDAPQAKPDNRLFVSLPDSFVFETEESAIAHVIGAHMDKFFDVATVEVEPPKGSFPFVNKCTITGELLGPPNYHRYQSILQQHHAARVSRMPFERFKERIETVRDPEVVNQWLEKMKKATRFTWKQPVAEGQPVPVFDNMEDARAYLLSQAKDKVVKSLETARFHGKLVDQFPQGELRRAVEGHLDRQRKFPLDTANALRGRLRREGFTIFKKGSKGISYVCAVKRKFRVPGQVFSDSIGSLISFIESKPMTTVKDLPAKFLGFAPPPIAVNTSEAIAGAVTEAPVSETTEATVAAPEGTQAPVTAPAPAVVISPEDQAKLRKMTMDLRWLVTEGYVTEFADGRLFAPPPLSQPLKKTADGEELDPENFPEVPAVESAPAPAAEVAPVESTPVVETAPAAEAPAEAPAPEEPKA